MIMLSVAAGWAMSEKAETIAYAAHSGDHAIYPDCRPEFVMAVKLCILLSDWRKVELYAPYVGMTKADIVKRGFNLGVPLERTWSCYKGGIKHCGRCGTCEERKTAFKIARVDDPTDYLDPAVRFDS
jgi:7-cyano-7-deazaguanine synthase